MRVRRWIGLIAAAVVLHTNAKAAFAACVLADSGVITAGSGSTHHHEEGSAPEETAIVTGEDDVPNDASGVKDCCQEMTSCGSSVILSQGAARTATGLAAAGAIPGESEALLGRTAEPEPPPPKA